MQVGDVGDDDDDRVVEDHMPFSTPIDRRFYECCIATRESREDIPDGLGAFDDGDDKQLT
jgi:hypothetical protein